MTATTAATKQIVLTREIATPTVLMALANLDFLASLLYCSSCFCWPCCLSSCLSCRLSCRLSCPSSFFLTVYSIILFFLINISFTASGAMVGGVSESSGAIVVAMLVCSADVYVSPSKSAEKVMFTMSVSGGPVECDESSECCTSTICIT